MSKITISPACLRDISYIGAHMREHDQREIMCQMPDNMTPQAAAIDIFGMTPEDTQFVAYRNNTPVAAYGFTPTHIPTLWSAWAFGTDELKFAIPAISRHGMTTLFPKFYRKYRPKRVEIRSIEGHDVAHKWLTAMGCNHEGVLTRYGKNGEDFHMYSWTDRNIWIIYEKWQRRNARGRIKRAA